LVERLLKSLLKSPEQGREDALLSLCGTLLRRRDDLAKSDDLVGLLLELAREKIRKNCWTNARLRPLLGDPAADTPEPESDEEKRQKLEKKQTLVEDMIASLDNAMKKNVRHRCLGRCFKKWLTGGRNPGDRPSYQEMSSQCKCSIRMVGEVWRRL